MRAPTAAAASSHAIKRSTNSRLKLTSHISPCQSNTTSVDPSVTLRKNDANVDISATAAASSSGAVAMDPSQTLSEREQDEVMPPPLHLVLRCLILRVSQASCDTLIDVLNKLLIEAHCFIPALDRHMLCTEFQKPLLKAREISCPTERLWLLKALQVMNRRSRAHV